MKRASRLLVVPILFALATAGRSAGDAQAPNTVLVVQVGDAMTGAFIADAQVRLPSAGRVARTRWDGEVQFADLANGKYRIQVRAIGYAPGDVEVALTGDTLPVFFSLERVSTALDTVRVRAEKPPRGLREFEERRKTGIGRFFTDSALQEHRAQGLQLMLVTGVPGLFVSGRAVITQNGPTGACGVLFYLDGFMLGQSLPRGGHAREPIDLDAIRPGELAGMEVYALHEAPPQYRPLGSYCKVVLLWSKW